MKCPDDGNKLSKHAYEDQFEVDQCDVCGGIWLDHAELEKIQDIRVNDYADELASIPDYFDKAHDLALARSEGTYACANCGNDMEKKEYAYCSQVMIDVCPSCRGVWLHKDEVAELEVFFEKSRAETAKVRSGFLESLLSYFD